MGKSLIRELKNGILNKILPNQKFERQLKNKRGYCGILITIDDICLF